MEETVRIINSASPNKNGDEKRTKAEIITQSPGIDEVDALPRALKYSNFDLLCTLISMATYIFDLTMDIIVAMYFYHLGVSHGIYHYWYFGLTILFIMLPSLTMTGFSFRWYLKDEDDNMYPDVPAWRWVLRLVILMLQIAPILRYFDSMRNGVQSRYYGYKARKETENMERKMKYMSQQQKYYTMMVYEDADATLLRLFECFMESAPQLVLQIYILIRDPHAIQINEVGEGRVDPIIKASILVVSVISSLVSLAWSLVVYHRSLRYTYENKNNINWAGSLVQFVWHFASITARVLALSLFAAIYPQFIGVVIAAHWVIMFSWILWQRTEACGTRCEELLFAMVLALIYVFSFFNAKDEKTRFKYLTFYLFCFIENTVLISFWAILAKDTIGHGTEMWYFYPSIIGHYISFFAGIFFMIVYYCFFHPTGVDRGFKSFFRPKVSDNQTNSTQANILYLREGQQVEQDEVDMLNEPCHAQKSVGNHSLPNHYKNQSEKINVNRSSSFPIPRKGASAIRTLKDMRSS